MPAEEPEAPAPEETAAAEAAEESEPERKLRHARRQITDLQRFGLQAFIFLAIIYVLFAFIVGVATAPNNDMYPRIDSGDLLLYYRLDKDPKAQDVVIFTKNDTRYVGRVIAVQGDTVEITDDGMIHINGAGIIEGNIFAETYRLEGYTQYPLTLQEGECFVLADRRRGCEDSRYFGPVQYSELQGTVISVLRRNNL